MCKVFPEGRKGRRKEEREAGERKGGIVVGYRGVWKEVKGLEISYCSLSRG